MPATCCPSSTSGGSLARRGATSAEPPGSHPIELAYLLRQNPHWARDSIQRALGDAVDRTVPLPEPMPIHLLYWTAWADGDGTIEFRRDIHDRDAPLRKALRARPPTQVITAK